MDKKTVSMAQKLERALTSHDLDGLVALFTSAYRSDWPCRPDRSFSGKEQVRKNWEQIFAGIPDVSWKLVRLAETPDTEWAEWEVTGTARNGVAVSMCGVTVSGVVDEQISWTRFYLEPVVHDDVDADAAVAATLSGSS